MRSSIAKSLWLLLPLLGAGSSSSSSSANSKQRPSAGCSKNTTTTSTSTTFAVNARTNRTLPASLSSSSSPYAKPGAVSNGGRPYTVWVPPAYDPASPAPVPLILSLHGASRDAAWQADLDRLTDPAFNPDHAVVYGQSTGAGEERFWEGFPGLPASVDDVAYSLAVLDAVVEDLCVDEARVYASGKSQGGGLASVLACDERSAPRFAALASVSGAYYVPGVLPADCDPEAVPIAACGRATATKTTAETEAEDDSGGNSNNNKKQRAATTVAAPPFLAFHGGNDTTIAYAGGERRGFCLPALDHWVAEWARRDGLPAEPAAAWNLTRDARAYAYGEDGAFTFVYDGDRVGHDWPATFSNTDSLDHGTAPASFNATSFIMEFFRNHTLPDSTETSPPTPSSTPSSADPTDSPAMVGVDGGDTGAAMSIPLGTPGQLMVMLIGLFWSFL